MSYYDRAGDIIVEEIHEEVNITVDDCSMSVAEV